MAVTIEVLEHLEKYFFESEQLPLNELDEIINKHPRFTRTRQNRLRTGEKESYELTAKDVFSVNVRKKNEYCKLVVYPKKRYIKVEKSKDECDFIDFREKKFEPIGAPQSQELRVGGEVFAFVEAYEYNFVQMLLMWSDEHIEELYVQNKHMHLIDCEKVYISKEVWKRDGLCIDEMRQYPVAIGHCKWEKLDFFNQIESEYSSSGSMLLYASKGRASFGVKMEDMYCELKELTSDWKSEIKPVIDLWDGGRGVPSQFRQLKTHRIFYEFNLYGNVEKKELYFFDNKERRGGLLLKLYNLRDYYDVATWMILAYSHYRIKTTDFIREYIPGYLDYAEAFLKRSYDTLDKMKFEKEPGELKMLYNEYPHAFENKKKLEAYLIDFIKDRRYIKLLLTVYEEGIYQELLNGNIEITMVRNKYFKILNGSYGVSEVMANRVVDDWVKAIAE